LLDRTYAGVAEFDITVLADGRLEFNCTAFTHECQVMLWIAAGPKLTGQTDVL
jgi:hypothetical protein